MTFLYNIYIYIVVRWFFLSGKKTKVIDFDVKMVDDVHKYMKTRGITTFSSAIREIVANELDRHGIVKEESDKKGEAIIKNSLTVKEQKVYEQIESIIGMYKIIREVSNRILQELEKGIKGKGIHKITTFEKLAFCDVSDKKIDTLFETIKKIFVGDDSIKWKIDEILVGLFKGSLSLQKDVDLYNIDSLEDLDEQVVKHFIFNYNGKMYSRNRRDELEKYEDEYNNFIELYFEYKAGNISKYPLIKVIGKYIDDINRVNI